MRCQHDWFVERWNADRRGPSCCNAFDSAPGAPKPRPTFWTTWPGGYKALWTFLARCGTGGPAGISASSTWPCGRARPSGTSASSSRAGRCPAATWSSGRPSRSSCRCGSATNCCWRPDTRPPIRSGRSTTRCSRRCARRSSTSCGATCRTRPSSPIVGVGHVLIVPRRPAPDNSAQGIRRVKAR
jgi:hypothetical protein